MRTEHHELMRPSTRYGSGDATASDLTVCEKEDKRIEWLLIIGDRKRITGVSSHDMIVFQQPYDSDLETRGQFVCRSGELQMG